MTCKTFLSLVCASVCLPGIALAQSGVQSGFSSADWQTPSEKSGYRTTPDYAGTMAYLNRIAAAAPGQVKIEPFGATGEGRELDIVIASKDGDFDPARIHAAQRPIVLLVGISYVTADGRLQSQVEEADVRRGLQDQNPDGIGRGRHMPNQHRRKQKRDHSGRTPSPQIREGIFGKPPVNHRLILRLAKAGLQIGRPGGNSPYYKWVR